MKSLIEVDTFGAVDADNDALLLDCFEDHEAFLRVIDRSRFLVVGRKGSGKTAIFKKMLMLSQHNYFCFGHTFSDYPWHHHDLQARIGIPDFDKFTHSWYYLILLTVSKIILNFDKSLPYDDDSMELMGKIEKFVVDTYGTCDPDVSQIFTPSKTLKLKPHFNLDFKMLKAEVSPENVPMKELPEIVQELNANLLRYVVRCLNPDSEYYICFDQLDLGFDPSAGDYKNRLIGLLLAARDINIAARRAEKKLFVVVFLRDDIYETLQFEDKNKITENFLSLIEWDTSRTDKTLKILMEKRFKVVLGGEPKWDDVFDETKEMSGRQSKYYHILDRTYLRPRDIIKFTNSVLSQYKRRNERDHTAADRFENIDLSNSRLEYSNYLLNELDDEIHKHLPHYKKLVELLRSIGVWQFTVKELEKKFSDHPDIAQHGSVKSILQELYDFSIIGFYRPGGRGYGGSEYVFKYKDPQIRLDPAAERFRIHAGLIDVLGLKRYTKEGGSGDNKQATASEPPQKSVTDIIATGESTTCEFKSTFQWDVRQEQVNKELRLATLKTVAAFLNTQGGTLLIGVEDDGTILGLENDIRTTSNSRDRFEQLLVAVLNKSIGVAYAPYYSIRFEAVDRKTVCVVDVKRSSEPVFMKGKKGKEFYTRPGNITCSLDVEEAQRYISLHW